MYKIMLCDQSTSNLKMMSFVIEQRNLGEVILEEDNGIRALDSIMIMNPHIVILDFKLNELDGNEVIRLARKAGFTGKFIMLTQEADSQVKTKAYENGVDIVIQKPINLVEVIHTVRYVSGVIKMQSTIASMVGLMSEYSSTSATISRIGESRIEREIEQHFVNIGLHGRSGAQELKELLLLIDRKKSEGQNYRVTTLIEDLAKKNHVQAKTLEQKIRRAMQKTMDYVAILGAEDFDNLVFDRYASTLFDYSEVRNHMNYLSKNGGRKGMLQMKKFIEGFYMLLQEN